MPAATDKQALLGVCRAAYAKLVRVIAGIELSPAMAKDAEHMSIKGVVAHRAHWIELCLGWQAEGAAGRKVHFPAGGRAGRTPPGAVSPF